MGEKLDGQADGADTAQSSRGAAEGDAAARKTPEFFRIARLAGEALDGKPATKPAQ